MTNKTIKDIIALVTKSEKSDWKLGSWDLEDLFPDHVSHLRFNEELESELQNNIKIFHVPSATWICTDTWVGLSVMYFKNEPVAVLFQSARKSGIDIKWLSPDYYKEVISFLYTLALRSEVAFVSTTSLDAEVDDGWFKQRTGWKNESVMIDL